MEKLLKKFLNYRDRVKTTANLRYNDEEIIKSFLSGQNGKQVIALNDDTIEELVEIVNHTSTSINYRNTKIREWVLKQS